VTFVTSVSPALNHPAARCALLCGRLVPGAAPSFGRAHPWPFQPIDHLPQTP